MILENFINFNWIGIETLAVILAIIYLFLAIKENSLCWYFVFLSAAIYIWIFISFIDVALKLENLFKAFFVTFSGLIAAFISVSMVLSLFVGLFNV